MPLDAALRAQILASVEAGFVDQIAYTQDLVRFASLRGDEHGIQNFIHDAMASRGYAMERFAIDRAAIAAHPGGGRFSSAHSDAPIIVGTHRPRAQKGRSLILQGHVDVVPTGPVDMWSRDPFDPHIDGDWLYGRGAGDMKSGDAAMLFCLDALRRIGYQPAAAVHIQSVVEEESTGNGALMTHLHGYKADAAFLPEPGHERLARANVGVIWFQVEVRGVPVHVSQMGTGLNAIDSAYRIVPALRELETAWNARKSDYPAFAGIAHPINLNIGKIEGGDWASSVPCWCRIDCRISLFPGQSASEAADEIRAAIDAFAATDPFLQANRPKLTFNGFFAEGYVLTPGSQAEATLGRAHEAAVAAPLQTTTATAYLDARVYALYDKIPALNYGPIAENIHGVDERVSLASIKRITGTMALFVADWCGLEAV